ncbi:carboxypeptidase-like regulatory domain-containing protein [Actinoplanes sp. NBC_00393]|uniref:carboxypeptidase-like regulatory domain-containing protein n=1 Tax=Actinoplanes sp. NBC_00393 TaxID=2975953 RepID=UPI002E2320A5
MRRSLRARVGLAILSGVLAAGALTAPAAAAEGTAIAGTVTDASGQPAAAVFVIVENVDGSANYLQTDESGAYSASVSPGSYRVSFQWNAHTQWAHQRVTADTANIFAVAEGETVRVDDQLLAPGAVNGHITKADGSPVPGAWVTLRRDGVPIVGATTDENGFYSIGEALPGEYQVAFEWNGLHHLPDTATVAAGTTTTVNGSLPQETTLLVKAVDSVTGAPVGAFCVEAWDLEEAVCSDAGDAVSVTGLSAGQARFNVVPSGSDYYLAERSLSATLTANEVTTVTVPLVFGGQIAVNATDRASGQPVDRTCYLIRAIGRPGNFSQGCTAADGAGKLDRPVAPGTYEVFVIAPRAYGHQWLGKSGGTGDQKQAARIVVKPGRTAKTPTVLLDPPGTITGVVTGADGTPLKGVGVHHHARSLHEWDGVNTDASGRYVISGLGPYAWPLNFSGSNTHPDQWSGNAGNRFQAVKIPVTAGGSSTYDIKLAKGSTLRGTIKPGSPEVRLIAHNAATGDPVGVFHGYDDGNAVTSYEMSLIGPQQVKILWDLYDGTDGKTWHAGATDISTATKVGIPASGVKKLNLTHK